MSKSDMSAAFSCQSRIAGFKFHKRCQLFIRSHDEPVPIATWVSVIGETP
jgi:hypothetical protein